MYIFKKKYLLTALALVLGVAMVSNEAMAQKKKKQEKKSVKVSGKVVEASSQQAISGATVKLQKADKKATTNEKGKFGFENIEPGTYNVAVKADGYKKWQKKVQVKAKDKTVEIELKTESK